MFSSLENETKLRRRVFSIFSNIVNTKRFNNKKTCQINSVSVLQKHFSGKKRGLFFEIFIFRPCIIEKGHKTPISQFCFNSLIFFTVFEPRKWNNNNNARIKQTLILELRHIDMSNINETKCSAANSSEINCKLCQ